MMEIAGGELRRRVGMICNGRSYVSSFWVHLTKRSSTKVDVVGMMSSLGIVWLFVVSLVGGDDEVRQ